MENLSASACRKHIEITCWRPFQKRLGKSSSFTSEIEHAKQAVAHDEFVNSTIHIYSIFSMFFRSVIVQTPRHNKTLIECSIHLPCLSPLNESPWLQQGKQKKHTPLKLLFTDCDQYSNNMHGLCTKCTNVPTGLLTEVTSRFDITSIVSIVSVGQCDQNQMQCLECR